MLISAVAALALAGSMRHQAGTNIICPLYDMTTSVDAAGNVTATFYLCFNWNSQLNSTSKFSFYFSTNVVSTNIGPNGNWYQIYPSAYGAPSGNSVSVTFPNYNFNGASNPTGILWVDYNGGANETADGVAEHSITATTVGGSHQGSNGRPGTIVPIIETAPVDKLGIGKQSVNQSVTFQILAGFAGWPNGNPPMWFNTGNNNSPYPGNGWQRMSYDQLAVAQGHVTVTATAHPNSNSGYYMVGYQQTYTPFGATGLWNEFSALVRTITGS